MPDKAPKAESPAAPVGFQQPETLARFAKINEDLGHIKKNLKFVQSTNNLIVIVVFLAFIVLVLTAGATIVDTLKSDTSSRNDLRNAVEKLNNKVDSIEAQQKNTTPQVIVVPSTSTPQ